jgi:hypothetical protein
MAESPENPKSEATAAPPEPRAEPDAPQSAFIFLFALGGVAILALMVLGVDQLFNLSLREEIAQKLLRPENSMLRQLRADEQAKLTRYQWIDRKAGTLRIPLDRAMELTLSEWQSRPAGYVPGAPNPATAPGGAAPAKTPAGESPPRGGASEGARGPEGAAPPRPPSQGGRP